MGEQIIHLRRGDRTQRLVGPRADHVAKTVWEPDGWERYTPEEPYDAAESGSREVGKSGRTKKSGEDAPPEDGA